MVDHELRDVLSRNLQAVRTRMAQACERSGRAVDEVRLVAVTKYAELSWVRALADLHPVFGENRPQQLAERRPQLPRADWHLIGQLQRNKARVAVQNAALIHSVDSQRLLERIAAVADELSVRPQILLQVNISREAAKSGFSSQELLEHWSEVTQHQKIVDICGLMTMAPASRQPAEARETFRGLAQLKQELCQHGATTANHLRLNELSMGMSGDMEIAIEEGATIVRVGSRLYEGLERKDPAI